MISRLGDNGRPAALAGHATWHRPHLVHASRSSSSFQVKSVMDAYPMAGACFLPSPGSFPGGSAGRRQAAFSSTNTRFAASVKMCIIFE